jgi:hypothetical protein
LISAPIVAASEISPGKLIVLLRDKSVGVLQFNIAGECTFIKRFEICVIGNAVSSGGKIAVIGEEGTVTVIEDGKGNVVMTMFGECKLFCPVGDEVLFSPDGVQVEAVGRTGVRMVCSARGKIGKLVADRAFHIVAVGTSDGWVRVFDLTTGNEVKSINIGWEPRLLTITPKWGFVVAVVGNEIVVMTVNGDVVKKQKIQWEIIDWWPFASRDDFDYVAFLTDVRTLGVFEVLHPEENALFQEAKTPLASVMFDGMSESFILVAEDGKLLILPYILK